jgi:hypothetical protein
VIPSLLNEQREFFILRRVPRRNLRYKRQSILHYEQSEFFSTPVRAFFVAKARLSP